MAKLLEHLPQQHGKALTVKTSGTHPPVLVKVEVRQGRHLRKTPTAVRNVPKRKYELITYKTVNTYNTLEKQNSFNFKLPTKIHNPNHSLTHSYNAMNGIMHDRPTSPFQQKSPTIIVQYTWSFGGNIRSQLYNRFLHALTYAFVC